MQLIIFLLSAFWIHAFSTFFILPATADDKEEIIEHLGYLASDEMKGRGIGTPEIDSAAAYIAKYFEEVGLQTIDGCNGYFQEFQLGVKMAPSLISFSIDEKIALSKEQLLMINGSEIDLSSAEIEYIDFGTEAELEGKSLEGKIVVTKMGFPDKDLLEDYFSLMENKRKVIQDKGALALIEIYKSNRVPWDGAKRYFGGGGLSIIDNKASFSHFFLSDTTIITALKEAKDPKGHLTVEIEQPKIIHAKNVIGIVIGTDPILKDEVILLGAHYDHVGIGRPVADEHGVMDSIYNGARDNASGVVALMMAAAKLAQNPPKRSVAFIAFTAEESGLIGSRYYASNPVIPLDKTVFCFNNDNGGYSDTSMVSVVGVGRSNVTSTIQQSIEITGLRMYQSPDLDQHFFGASDNISLSVKGIPSATYSLGFTGMDAEIQKYYHQPADEIESMDMEYISKWIDGYVNAAKNIANMDEKPFWTTGDEFEEVGEKLYKLE